MSKQRLTGKRAEDLACRFLQGEGLLLIGRNYHCRFGEIDLIMQDHDDLVFIEVRYRRSARYGSGAESVDHNKQRKIIFTANHYLQAHPSHQACRFDVVTLAPDQAPQWIINAFTE